MVWFCRSPHFCQNQLLHFHLYLSVCHFSKSIRDVSANQDFWQKFREIDSSLIMKKCNFSIWRNFQGKQTSMEIMSKTFPEINGLLKNLLKSCFHEILFSESISRFLSFIVEKRSTTLISFHFFWLLVTTYYFISLLFTTFHFF